MRMSLLPLLLVLLSPFFSATINAKADPPSAAPRKAKIAGGWATVQDLKDPHILEIAKFAVSEYNQRNKTNLTLSQLVAAQKQVVDGTKYRLKLQVKDNSGGSPATCAAVVLEKPWQNDYKELVSFAVQENGYGLRSGNGAGVGSDGGWKPLENMNDSQVHEIAEFAVSQHNKEANTKLTLSEVIKVETQVVQGLNYKILLTAKDAASGDQSRNYEAVVWQRASQNVKQLTSFKNMLTSS
ncbi:hypothetical protein Cni_G26414 [Canna indica]|uniref:Cystatin domain-containing protein n=1 Tax=Canna indica TaxID=4628 RepID=A0AAQ3L3Q7_9LILI|nr:hypothetical protein Cni_G26414 [Canna indica]